MADFSEQFPDAELLTALSDSLTYKRGTDTYPIKGIIEQVGANEALDELHSEAYILKSDLAFAPQRGDVITIGSESYAVDKVIPNNSNLYTLVIR